MTAQDRATARDAAQTIDRAGSPGAMALQSDRGYEAVPQAFVRLSGSHLAKPGAGRKRVTE